MFVFVCFSVFLFLFCFNFRIGFVCLIVAVMGFLLLLFACLLVGFVVVCLLFLLFVCLLLLFLFSFLF